MAEHPHGVAKVDFYTWMDIPLVGDKHVDP